MNGDYIDNAIAALNVTDTPKRSTKQEAIMAVRLGIVTKLLVYSYHALGLTPPVDDILEARVSIIAERADVSNRELKAAFHKALDIKMEKDLRTPITDGDITRAAVAIAESSNSSYSGKWRKALPLLRDGELWDDSVKTFAKVFARDEFQELLNIDRGLITNG